VSGGATKTKSKFAVSARGAFGYQNSCIRHVSANVVGRVKTLHRIRHHGLNFVCNQGLPQLSGEAGERLKIS
jgi:hypothetical protein